MRFHISKYLTSPLSESLSSIRSQIETLRVPAATYAEIDIQDKQLLMAEIGGEKIKHHKKVVNGEGLDATVYSALKRPFHHRPLKFVAVGLRNKDGVINGLASKLWLDKDVVPFVWDSESKKDASAEELAREVASNFDQNNIIYPVVSKENEVIVRDLVSLEDYEKISRPDDIALLKHLSQKFSGKKLAFINATPQGGGVALMRHALIRLFKLLGVDVHWYVLEARKEVFDITKTKFHNVLQNVVTPDIKLTENEKSLYTSWIKENAEMFEKVFKQSDVVVIDDPQPSGLIPYIKKINPKAKIMYRSHIQIEAHLANQKDTSQYITWQFIWNNIKSTDLFVSHPIKQFIPQDVPNEKVVLMPAVTDPLDGLNKTLTDDQLNYYIKLFDKFLLEEEQTPLDNKRPYIIQIARFDPSKGIPDVIESYRELVEKLKKYKETIPQLIITGNGSIDDPDRTPIYNMTMELINSEKYRHLKNDIKVARLPHIDQLLNTLIRKSLIVLQLSTKEGFEIKVSEGLMKGKPVIAYRTGGIPLQIKDGVTGYLIEAGNTQEVAEKIFNLLTDQALYEKISKQAEEQYDKDVLTVGNAINWLFLSLQLLEDNHFQGQGRYVMDLARHYWESVKKQASNPS